MPKILEDAISKIMKQGRGMPRAKATAIATSSLQKAGDMVKGSQTLTPKGAKRQAMGEKAREKSRAAKSKKGSAK